jgi:acyl-CoA thioesterase I
MAVPLALAVAESRAQTKVAAIGASTTRGSGAPAGQSYPDQLQRLLGPTYQVRNFGRNGAGALRQGDPTYWNSPEQRAAAALAPDIVVNWLGGADSKAASWDAHGAEFLGDYKAMIEYFQALPSRPKIISMMSVARYNDAGVRKDVLEREVNPLQRRGALEMGSRFIDTKALLADRAEYFTDGVHLTAAGYAIVAKAVEAEVRALAAGPDGGSPGPTADAGASADAGDGPGGPDGPSGGGVDVPVSGPDAPPVDAAATASGSDARRDAPAAADAAVSTNPSNGGSDGGGASGCACALLASGDARPSAGALLFIFVAIVPLVVRRWRRPITWKRRPSRQVSWRQTAVNIRPL